MTLFNQIAQGTKELQKLNTGYEIRIPFVYFCFYFICIWNIVKIVKISPITD